LGKFPAQANAIHTWQTEIEQNYVEFLRYGKMQARYFIRSHIQTMPASFKKIVKVRGNREIVFYSTISICTGDLAIYSADVLIADKAVGGAIK